MCIRDRGEPHQRRARAQADPDGLRVPHPAAANAPAARRRAADHDRLSSAPAGSESLQAAVDSLLCCGHFLRW